MFLVVPAIFHIGGFLLVVPMGFSCGCIIHPMTAR